MKSNEDMIQKMAKKADCSLVKARDLPLFDKVKRFLNDRGLEVEVRGSVVENALKGQLRQYGDIDLLVPNDGSQEFREAYMDLARSFKEVPGFEESLAQFITAYTSDMGHYYVNDRIDQRFTLKDGKTVIDLSFQSPISGLVDAFDREVPTQYLPSKIPPYLRATDFQAGVRSNPIPPPF